MRRNISILAIAAGVALTVTLATGAGRPLSTTLEGENERPTPGDPDGTGTFTAAINPGTGEICYELTVSGIEAATAAHIHIAPPDSAGPVVVALAAPTDGSSEGCIEVDRALAIAILKNPESYYVNVHNAPYPAGAVRGQLSK
jgi:hypothetical protein